MASNVTTWRVYLNAVALDAGVTNTHSTVTCHVDAQGCVRSVYQSGKNLAAKKAAEGLPIIREGIKRRDLWVLAAKGTLEYAIWRRALTR